MARTVIEAIVLLGLGLLVASPSEAARRSLRVDIGGWEERIDFGQPGCPGTVAVTPQNEDQTPAVLWEGHVFMGGRYEPIDFKDPPDPYESDCEPTVPGQFAGFTFPPDESGLGSLVGDNADDAVSAIRYTVYRGYFTSAFQWIFYFFPRGITVVGFYGIDPELPLDGRTFIQGPSGTVFSAEGDSFAGDYFCFQDGVYLGTWGGDLADAGSECLARLAFRQVVFESGFEDLPASSPAAGATP